MDNISLNVHHRKIPTKQKHSLNPDFEFTNEEINRVINTGSSYERTILLLEDDANDRELIAGLERNHLLDLITFDDAPAYIKRLP